MKRYLSLLPLLCAAPLYAGSLTGKFIPQANLPGCDPYALADQTEQSPWPTRANPRHCSTINQSNPIFVWTRPSGATSADAANFELLDSAGGTVWTSTTDRARLIYPGKLGRGTYQWRVSYLIGGVKKTSSLRTFYVESTFALPTADKVLEIASNRSHPRALPAGATYMGDAGVRSRIERGNRAEEMLAAFKKTVAEADLFVNKDTKNNSTNIVERHDIFVPSATSSSNDLAQGSLRERRAIELLGHIYFLTNETKYLNACKERLLSLEKWDDSATAPTSQKSHDQANREAFLGLALGLDIFEAIKDVPADSPAYPYKLSAADRDKILDRVASRIRASTDQFKQLDDSPYDSHIVSATHYATEALMYLVGMDGFAMRAPDADKWLKDAWTNLVTAVGVWGGTSDGGFGNGTSYAWYSTNKNARSLAAVRLITGEDLTKFAPMGKIGMNLIAQTPPANKDTYHHQMGMFGDGTDYIKQFRDYAGDDFRLLAYATQSAAYEWYWRTKAAPVTQGTHLLPYNFLLLGIADPLKPQGAPLLQDSFLFEDAGYVVFHSDTISTNRTSLFFRSSPQGTASHAQADNNAVAFVSKGYEVLISSGFYKEWKEPHFDAWTRHTRAKNALTISVGTGAGAQAEIGQAQQRSNGVILNEIQSSVEARGKLINYHDQGKWRIATGDATSAYRTFDTGTKQWDPLLSKAIRSVAYHKIPGVVLIYDYATSEQSRFWGLNFHTLTAPIATALPDRVEIPVGPWVPVEANSPRSKIAPNGKVCLHFHGPASGRSIVDAPKSPSNHDYVTDQFHTRWTTADPSGKYAALTIVTEDCSTVTPQRLSDTKFKVEINGSTITFDQEKVDFTDSP